MEEQMEDPDYVRNSTKGEVNEDIDMRTIRSISHTVCGGREAIDARIEALDKEWDIERALQMNSAAVTLAGAVLAVTKNKAWLGVPILVSGFLIYHTVKGWCPPLPVLRKFGFRTRDEIAKEKYALKAIRGDFDEIIDPEDAWDAVNE
jgi:hypothetical protein